MINSIVVFQGKPKNCSECVGKFYCKTKTPEKCCIRQLPARNSSGIEDEYSQGWDKAVSRVLLLPEEYHRDCVIPVEEMKCCKFCTTSLGGPIGVSDGCPFKNFFISTGNCECFKGSLLEEMYRYQSDKSGEPGKADYDAGYRDGFNWVMEELGFKMEA